MHPTSYVSIIMSGSAERFLQERIQEAERDALAKVARFGKPTVFASSRMAIGQIVVSLGRLIAGRPQREERALDVPVAFKIAR